MARIRTIGERIDRWSSLCMQSDGDCWIWTGAKSGNGYGQTRFAGSSWMAHRIFYTYFRTEIPARLDLDHLCRNRACVNPWHLEPVTRSVNLRRGDTRRTHNSSKTSCPKGHGYSAANTAVRNGKRSCRACDRLRAQRNRDRKVAA